MKEIGNWIGRAILSGASAGIEPRLFLGLSLLGALVSLLVIVPTNYLQGIFPLVTWLVAVFGLGSLAVHLAARAGRFYVKTLFFMLLGLLDLIWFGNGGSHGSIGMFFFTGSMFLVIFFRGRTRWAMLALQLANGLGLLLLEYRMPTLVTPYADARGRLFDLSIGFVVCNLICILILWVVLESYHRERADLGRALEGLRESEVRFRGLYESTTDLMYWVQPGTDGDFLVEDLNPAAERFFQIGRREAKGRPLGPLFPGGSSDLQAFRDCAKQGRTLVYESVHERGGQGMILETLLVPVPDEEGRVRRLVAVSRDLTRSRAMEEALRQSQKLESLGVLAGGIAHDFNNLLAAMLGNLNLAQMKLGTPAEAGPHLESVERTILRASDLTRQMLAYAGRGRFVVGAQDLNAVVGELLGLLRASIPRRIELAFEAEEGLPAITADAAQLQQVVVNLVTNAAEAIGEGDGRIRLATRRLDLDRDGCAGFAPSGTLRPGVHVLLTVEDDGCGMPASTRIRIFEPFFTTKDSGRGLGLSAMLGILKGHAAGIRIWSEPGRGTRFELAFPVDGLPAPPDSLEGRQGRRPLEGDAVLVVDDEEPVLEATCGNLESMGFKVLRARDGAEAVERFRADGAQLALVLMDLSMPRMDGREAFLAIQALRPGFPVILASGYDAKDLAEIAPMPGFAGFLRKPFSHDELRRALDLPPRQVSLS